VFVIVLAELSGTGRRCKLHCNHRRTVRFAALTRGLNLFLGSRPTDHVAASASFPARSRRQSGVAHSGRDVFSIVGTVVSKATTHIRRRMTFIYISYCVISSEDFSLGVIHSL